MLLQGLDLTTALRPELNAGESLLFVQDAVGLYEGKFKIPTHQNGHLYLTTHRVCYIDNSEPRKNSTAVNLRDIDGYEHYAGFLKSSPKVTLHPKLSRQTSLQLRSYDSQPTSGGTSPQIRSASTSPFPRGSTTSPNASSPSARATTWICPICSYSNTLPPTFDATAANERTLLPPCKACGIKPPLAHVLKAAITSAAGRRSLPNSSFQSTSIATGVDEANDLPQPSPIPPNSFSLPDSASDMAVQCLQCTFQNHPSLLACEMCGFSLVTARAPLQTADESTGRRPQSPGPTLDATGKSIGDGSEYIRISFRDGGDKVFYERLKGAMIQRKWLSQHAPPVPQPKPSPLLSGVESPSGRVSGRETPETRAVGIAGLERLGMERRKNNEAVLSSAFEDLEALMASAKEVIDIAESFSDTAHGSSPSAALDESTEDLVVGPTKNMLSSPSASDLYISELSRNLAEYLTDDRKDTLRKEGGIMSLVDLWAKWNRARNGVELISPEDFEKAARAWARLNLPVRLREFKNGLRVVQRSDWTDDKTIAQLLGWFQELRGGSSGRQTLRDFDCFGSGVTAQETAQRFGWSVGVATEELEMAEEKGVLCREEGVEGLRFWENWILDGNPEPNDFMS